MSNRESSVSINDFTGYLFDLDGCLYTGNSVLPGAVELLEFLRCSGKQIAFVSNNSTQEAEVISQRLNRFGIKADPFEVIVPSAFIGTFLSERYGLVAVYPLAGRSVLRSLMKAGHSVVGERDLHCDIVLVARDIEFNYYKLEQASRYLCSGARLVATNADASHPGEYGYPVPETGALLAALLAISEKTVNVLGKPETFLFDKALERLRLTPDRVVMIGDNLLTDIVGAERAGIRSVWLNRGGLLPSLDIVPWKECMGLEELLHDLKASVDKEKK